MTEKLYIHIGGPKTGTTALQLFLARNRQSLIRKGFCYPGTDDAHWDICTNVWKQVPGEIRARTSAAACRYLAEIEQSSCHTAILSSEFLTFSGDAGFLRDLIPRTLPVTIVYYARRQDSLTESHYNQWIKSEKRLVKDRLEGEYAKSIYSQDMFDHVHVITPWANSFGKENILVRCYEYQQLHGDIIGDFVHTIGLVPDETFTFPGMKINTGIDQHHAEFIRVCNNAFPDAPDIRNFLTTQRFHTSRIFKDLPKRAHLSPATRREILTRFESSNEMIAREYLGREDGRLFYEPWPDPGDPWEPYTGMSAGELARIINEMIMNMDQRQQDMEPLFSLLTRLNKAAGIIAGILPKPFRWAPAAQAGHRDGNS